MGLVEAGKRGGACVHFDAAAGDTGTEGCGRKTGEKATHQVFISDMLHVSDERIKMDSNFNTLRYPA